MIIPMATSLIKVRKLCILTTTLKNEQFRKVKVTAQKKRKENESVFIESNQFFLTK